MSTITGPEILDRHACHGARDLRTVIIPGQPEGAATMGPSNAALRPASELQGAGLPGAQAAPPAGDLGDASVASPAATRCAEATRRHGDTETRRQTLVAVTSTQFWTNKYCRPGEGRTEHHLACGHSVLCKASEGFPRRKRCAECLRVPVSPCPRVEAV